MAANNKNPENWDLVNSDPLAKALVYAENHQAQRNRPNHTVLPAVILAV